MSVLYANYRGECESCVILLLALYFLEMLAVYELGADMHTRIDPVEEARAMVGDDRVFTLNLEPE